MSRNGNFHRIPSGCPVRSDGGELSVGFHFRMEKDEAYSSETDTVLHQLRFPAYAAWVEVLRQVWRFSNLAETISLFEQHAGASLAQ